MPILCKHVRSYVHTQATHHTISDMPIPWVNFSNPHLKKYMCLFSRKWWYILIQLAWATPKRNDCKSDLGALLWSQVYHWKMMVGRWSLALLGWLIFRGPMLNFQQLIRCALSESLFWIFSVIGAVHVELQALWGFVMLGPSLRGRNKSCTLYIAFTSTSN